MQKKIPVEVSARHCHLSQKDIDKLFWKGYQLKKDWQLTQPSDFAAKEKIEIRFGKAKLSLRIIGPAREKSQVELSITDAIKLGIKPVLRISGDLAGTPGAVLVGPNGRVKMAKGVIIALRHLHCTPKEAKRLGLKNGQIIGVKIKGDREVILNRIKVRVKDDYKLCCHLDTDEGNAAGINQKTVGFLE